MKYTFQDEGIETVLDITFDYEPGQKSDGQEVEPIEAGITAIYAVDENDNDKWDELPKWAQREIEKLIDEEHEDQH